MIQLIAAKGYRESKLQPILIIIISEIHVGLTNME